jgi:hypothetical protein
VKWSRGLIYNAPSPIITTRTTTKPPKKKVHRQLIELIHHYYCVHPLQTVATSSYNTYRDILYRGKWSRESVGSGGASILAQLSIVQPLSSRCLKGFFNHLKIKETRKKICKVKGYYEGSVYQVRSFFFIYGMLSNISPRSGVTQLEHPHF